jgi:hypothetical protein
MVIIMTRRLARHHKTGRLQTAPNTTCIFNRNSGIHPIAEESARVHAMVLSPPAAEDLTRFFTRQPRESRSTDG